VSESARTQDTRPGFGAFAVFILLAVVVGPAVSSLLREVLGVESGLANAIGSGLTLPPAIMVAIRGQLPTHFRTLLAPALGGVAGLVIAPCAYLVSHDSPGIVSWFAVGVGISLAVGIGVLTMRHPDPPLRR